MDFWEKITDSDVAAFCAEPTDALLEACRQYDVKVASGQSQSGGGLQLLSLSSRINVPAVLSGRGLHTPGGILLDPKFCRRLANPFGQPRRMEGVRELVGAW